MTEQDVQQAIAELRAQPHVSVETAGRAMHCGRGLAYRMAREGALPTIRIGRKKIRVLSRPLLERLQAE